MSVICKKCGSVDHVRNGFVQCAQRYKCKGCGFNFIEGDKRQKYTSADRLKVVKLYLENCGIRSIERLTGIRNSQISKWIEDIAKFVKGEFIKSQNNLKSVQDVEIMEVDELCTYIKKGQRMEENSSLFGLLLIEGQIKLLILK
jgi:transposase-like protein